MNNQLQLCVSVGVYVASVGFGIICGIVGYSVYHKNIAFGPTVAVAAISSAVLSTIISVIVLYKISFRRLDLVRSLKQLVTDPGRYYSWLPLIVYPELLAVAYVLIGNRIPGVSSDRKKEDATFWSGLIGGNIIAVTLYLVGLVLDRCVPHNPPPANPLPIGAAAVPPAANLLPANPPSVIPPAIPQAAMHTTSPNAPLQPAGFTYPPNQHGRQNV